MSEIQTNYCVSKLGGASPPGEGVGLEFNSTPICTFFSLVRESEIEKETGGSQAVWEIGWVRMVFTRCNR